MVFEKEEERDVSVIGNWAWGNKGRDENFWKRNMRNHEDFFIF